MSWSKDSSGTGNTFSSVYFTDSTTGYAVGRDGMILKTGNGGTNFIPVNNKVSSGFSVYPNPATGKFCVENTQATRENLCISLYTNSGLMIRQIKFNDIIKVEVGIKDLPPGIYIVKIQSNEGTEVKKVVVE